MNTLNTDKLTLQALDFWFDYRARFLDKPGLQFVLRRGRGVVFNKAYGFANRETKEPMTRDHFCDIASQSKMMTSCAMYILQENKSLSLSELAVDHLPELDRHWDKRATGITLRDLLTHRSGFVRDGMDASFWNLESKRPSSQDVLEQASLADIVFEPNTVTKYSNFAFSLLGTVIERTSGLSYEAYIQQNVISPICHEGLMPNDRHNFLSPPVFAQGYSRPMLGGKRIAVAHVPSEGFAPALGGQATALGMNHFAYQFLNGTKLITAKSQKDIKGTFWPFENMTDCHYGLGVDKRQYGKLTFIGHKGDSFGFSSSTQALVGTDYIFSVNQNAIGAEDVLSESALLMQRVNELFDKKGVSQTHLSPPLMGVWGANVYVVGPSCALEIPLDSTRPATDAVVLKRGNGAYFGHEVRGIGAVGEKVSFIKDRAGQIIACDVGGLILRPEPEFIQHMKAVRDHGGPVAPQ